MAAAAAEKENAKEGRKREWTPEARAAHSAPWRAGGPRRRRGPVPPRVPVEHRQRPPEAVLREGGRCGLAAEPSGPEAPFGRYGLRRGPSPSSHRAPSPPCSRANGRP